LEVFFLNRLGRSFFERSCAVVARELIGKRLVCGACSGRIVETEAYLGESDAASHASRKSALQKGHLMFGGAGISYVYLNYGVHWLFNVVAEKRGVGGAVLFRAIEPIEGVGLMKKRRGVVDELKLCSGPGKLSCAFGLSGKHNGLDLVESKELFFVDVGEHPEVVVSQRVGIAKGKEHMLRFCESGNRFVSR
jgi:DNA-3-methyladenine glycosylase